MMLMVDEEGKPERRPGHLCGAHAGPSPTLMGANQHLGNLVLILARARAAIRNSKVKIKLGAKAVETLHWDQIMSLEPALI